MSKTRAERAEAVEEWAERVESSGLTVADTGALRAIAELTERRGEVEQDLTEAVRSARQAQRSWSEIGTMLETSSPAEVRVESLRVDRQSSVRPTACP